MMKHRHSKQIFLIILACAALVLASCAPKISFQVKRPPQYPIDRVEFVAIDQFVGAEGNISSPVEPSSSKNSIKPVVGSFPSSSELSTQAADLARAMVVSGLSATAPYQIINTTGEKTAYSGVLPEPSKTAIIRAKAKYSEQIFERSEKIPYVVSIHNQGGSLQQQLLARAGSFAAERAGSGFEEPTPYVEIIGAMEIEFELLRQSDNSPIIPKQAIRAYYTKKWGGDDDTSHLPENVREHIIEKYQSDETNVVDTIFSEAGKAALALNDPDAYLAQGFNLKQNRGVPSTLLDLRIRLAQQITTQYLKMISPYEEQTDLKVLGGDDVAVTLINGNAYEDAIARIQGLPQPTAEDKYNLGLAYEASGQFALAAQSYEIALEQSPGEQLYKDALKRLKN